MEKNDFWTSTPRKLTLLLDQHIKYTQMINGVEPDTVKHDEESFNELLQL
jgi:hypothetical protein